MVTINKSAPAPVQTETPEQELKRLKAENASLTAAVAGSRGSRKFGVKVGAKGGVQISIPGSRFPLTPYATDLVTIIEEAGHLLEFMVANQKILSFGKEGDPASVTDLVRTQTLVRIAKLLG